MRSAEPVPSLPEERPAVARQPFRLRASAALFTYNVQNLTEDDFSEFVSFIETLENVVRWTATLEESLHATESGRLHLHCFLEFSRAPDWATLQPLTWRGVLPNCSACKARGPRWREAADQGHFYCWAWKLGTRCVRTSNHEPWVHYTVRGTWLDLLWSGHKLSHEVYLEYAAKVRLGFITRSKQVEAVVAHEQMRAFEAEQAAAVARLAPLKRPFKADVVERLQAWASQYEELQPRYKFCVLRAGSRCGKSTLAKSLHDLFPWKPPFIQTVQDDSSADLRSYCRTRHGYIVFDNVNSMQFVLSQRALMQSNSDVHSLGQSKTGIYRYSVYIFAVPIIMTVDHSAEWDSSEPWLAENMELIDLYEPCFES